MSNEQLARAKIYYGAGSFLGDPDNVGETLTKIPNVFNLTPPAPTRPEAQVTNLESTAIEKLATLAEFSDGSFEIYADPDSTEHQALFTDSIAAAGTQRNWRIELLDPSDQSVQWTIDFVGTLSGYTPTETPNQPRTAAITLLYNNSIAVAYT